MDTKENLSKCCIIFQIFGFIHFSIKNLSIDSNLSIFYTIKFIIIVIILAIQTIVFAKSIFIGAVESFDAKMSLHSFVQLVFFFLIFFVMIVAYIQSFTSTKLIKRIFINLIKISKIFREDFLHSMDFGIFKLWLYKLNFFTTIIFIVAHVFITLFETYYNVENSVVRNIIETIQSLIFMIIFYKYLFFVKLVNYNLEHLIDSIKNELNSSKIILEIKLKKLREIYALIQEIVKLINDSMGLTILVYITSLVISQINIIYNLLLILIGDYPAEYTCCKFHI